MSGDEQSRKRRSGKRVVALSRVDQERLQRGELRYPEQALLHDGSATPVVSPQGMPPAAALAVNGKQAINREDLTPREREILDNLPPHFGKI
ncbi:MAG: hypothetical protein PT944_04895 [Actinomycetaceae bacterium]|nr:hypothetical protein [Arcanobacterium sp.]MDD7687237.1 hypothetical protein [Actinomycetaceae bacterium]MDY5273465.1 hypothetical protein [Arcanobacterium sp.]